MDNKLIGARIRALRKARGITQKQLGDAILRSESSIAKYEQGLVDIPIPVLMDIAQYLSVDGAELLGVANVSPTPSISAAAFKWLESLGFKIRIYDDDDCGKSIALRDLGTFASYEITEEQLKTLIDSIGSYTRFQVQELIKAIESKK